MKDTKKTKEQLIAELAESEEKYRIIFKNIGTAVIIIEEDKTITMANTQFEKLSGYSNCSNCPSTSRKTKWFRIS